MATDKGGGGYLLSGHWDCWPRYPGVGRQDEGWGKQSSMKVSGFEFGSEVSLFTWVAFITFGETPCAKYI